MIKVTLLREGRCHPLEDPNGIFDVDCSVTLIQYGIFNVLFDTGGAWMLPQLVHDLASAGLSPADVTHVICSHGHSDHVGCLSAFPDALHVVGRDFNQRHRYSSVGFSPSDHPIGIETLRMVSDTVWTGIQLQSILAGDNNDMNVCGADAYDGIIKLMTTPGHTGHCCSLFVECARGISFQFDALRSHQYTRIAIVGDLWESCDDESFWRSLSEMPTLHEKSRAYVLEWKPDLIIPGHGPPFAPPKIHAKTT
jgi:glyoxylase-like metal-dependent hydrolase (beta-lactamase superfamily II)